MSDLSAGSELECDDQNVTDTSFVVRYKAVSVGVLVATFLEGITNTTATLIDASV